LSESFPMQYFNPPGHCRNCHLPIDHGVLAYSTKNFDYPLCIPCQQDLRGKLDISTEETVMLYFSLKDRYVPAELEKFDGYKTIDIAVVQARVNIEVDGGHHFYDLNQAFADLQRTFYAFKKGFLTLRIPNILVTKNLEETADFVTEFLNQTPIILRS
jgi:hypothetical protein